MSTVSFNDALKIVGEVIAGRLREHDSELGKIAAQIAAQELRLEAHNNAINAWVGVASSTASAVERLEARIAAPVAPESVETMLRLPEEPGNATEAQSVTFSQWLDMDLTSAARLGNELLGKGWLRMHQWINADPEVAAALRMYRKVQALEANGFAVRSIHGAHVASNTAASLLAYLKESQA